MRPTLVQVKGGWHAVGRGWAVFGVTKEEALAKFDEAEKRHALIMARSEPQPIGA